MNRIITDNKTTIIELCKKHDVSSLYLFGSVLRDDFTDDSDIDLLVTFDNVPLENYAENFFSFSEELEKLFNRKVDLVSERSLRNTYFISQLEQTRQYLYGTKRDKISTRYNSVH